MLMDDPNTWLEGATALKVAFDAFRSAINLVRDIRKGVSGNDPQTKAIDEALDHAVRTAAIAEAQIAKALGYELCKCQFPPTIMLTVGNTGVAGPGKGAPVYECPKCGYNTAAPWTYNRIAPKRTVPK
jgi:hypothetical protein